MKIIKTIFLFFLLIIPHYFYSQEISLNRPFVYYPGSLQKYKLHTSIGLTIARLPRPIVEEELDQAPMLDFHFRYGLPLNFSLFARINTIAITNHLSGGFAWSYSPGRFSFNIGNSIAYWFGWADFSNFDVRTNGFIDYPEISLGYDFRSLLLTLRLEAEYQLSLNSYSGDIQTKANKTRVTGFSFSLLTEQVFVKQNWITLGLKLRYSRYFYQSWISFSTLEQWFWTPEFILAYNL
jgi:hypothetical protein